MAKLITGDAVTLDLRVAGFASRFIALAVDLTLQISVMLAFLVAADWLASSTDSPGVSATLSILAMVFALIVLPTAVETLTRGRSLGKAMMGLRVLRDDGGPVRMRHALVRAMTMVFVDLWTTSGVVGALACLGTRQSQRVGDMLAGTIVVGEKVPMGVRASGQVITMPPQLASWAATLDLVTLPDELALNVRTFLHRYPRLDPTTRDHLAAGLATQVAGQVHNPAPHGTPAVAYLSAVMAERTARAVEQLRTRRVGISAPAGPPSGVGTARSV